MATPGGHGNEAELPTGTVDGWTMSVGRGSWGSTTG
jgi:hypothetical protein